MEEKKHPLFKISAGKVRITAWENKAPKGNFITMTLTKIYKDENRNWQETNNYSKSDLMDARTAIDEALRRLVKEIKKE